MAHPMIGQPPALVAVPTHFYKVVLAESAGLLGKQVVVGAFVMPNKVRLIPIDAIALRWLRPGGTSGCYGTKVENQDNKHVLPGTWTVQIRNIGITCKLNPKATF